MDQQWGYGDCYSHPGGGPHRNPSTSHPSDLHRTVSLPTVTSSSVPDSSTFTTLPQFCDHVITSVGYHALRQKMCDLYSGLPQDDWFLLEIARGIDRIVPYSAGVSFALKIDSLAQRHPPDWTNAILEHWRDLLRFEPGVQLLLDTVRRQPIDANVITQVEQIISDFESRPRDHFYLDFFQGLVKVYRANDPILSSLYSFKWEMHRELMPYFAVLVQYIPFDRLRKSIENIVDHPLTYANDQFFALGYAAVLKYVREERMRMTDYLVDSIHSYLTSVKSDCVWREVIDSATSAQKDDLLAKFESSLQQAQCIPPNLEMAFDRLLVSLSTQKRLEFLERNQENLKFITF
jgi:hypothetical protein